MADVHFTVKNPDSNHDTNFKAITRYRKARLHVNTPKILA